MIQLLKVGFNWQITSVCSDKHFESKSSPVSSFLSVRDYKLNIYYKALCLFTIPKHSPGLLWNGRIWQVKELDVNLPSDLENILGKKIQTETVRKSLGVDVTMASDSLINIDMHAVGKQEATVVVVTWTCLNNISRSYFYWDDSFCWHVLVFYLPPPRLVASWSSSGIKGGFFQEWWE